VASPIAGLSRTIGGALAGVFFDATLYRDTAAAGTNDWTPGAVTTTSYPCKALADAWSAYQIAGGMVAASDAKVLILAASISIEPQAGDRVTVRGETYTLVSDGGSRPAVMGDPAKALWECRGRR
jgi:hypothetical protein